MNKYAFFDIDGTIYDGYITSEFYLFLANKNLIENPAFVYETDKKIGDLYYGENIGYREASRRVIELAADILKVRTVREVNKWLKLFMNQRKKIFPWVDTVFSLLKE